MQQLNLASEDLYTLFETTLGAGCRMKLQCPGYSMSPLIRHNSCLTIKPIENGVKPEFGDVVAAVGREKRVIIHRIVGCRNKKYLLKGDNCPECDGWFHRTRIMGIVEIVVDENGRDRTRIQHFKRCTAYASRTNVLKHIVVPTLFFLKKNN